MNMNNLTPQAKKLYTELVEPFIKNGQFIKVASGQQRPDFHVFQATADLHKSGQAIPTQKVSWNVAKSIYNELPTKCKNFLKETGKAKHSGWFNADTGQCGVPSSPSTHSRGILVLQRYLEQGGLCEFSGLKCDGPGFMVVDHVKELGADGGTDHVDNWAYVGAELNGWKKAKDWSQFIEAVFLHVLPLGKTKWNAKNKTNKKAATARAIIRGQIKGWTAQQIKSYLKKNNLKVPNKHMEYIGRNINIKALGIVRVKANGQKRTGGCERNYSVVLNALRLEYVFGSKTKARKLYNQARANDQLYVNQVIDAQGLAELHANTVESCSIIPKTYKRARLISRIVKSRSK